MDQLFFGVRKTKRSTRRSPRRSPRRTRRSPRRSPRRSTRCTKELSLSALRKLALENGVNIYSEAKVAISKRTGMPKKPKMVGCSTLKKRLNEAGLGYLYKTRSVKEQMGPDMMGPDMNVQSLFDQAGPTDVKSSRVLPTIYQADPACADAFMRRAQAEPNNMAQAKFLKQYKGYAVGDGPCSQRTLVPMHISGDEDELENYTTEAGFDMSFGQRYRSGARPKKSQKHVGTITVKGRMHHVFRGLEGGLYYLKGKTGRKVYIDKKRLSKRSPKRR